MKILYVSLPTCHCPTCLPEGRLDRAIQELFRMIASFFLDTPVKPEYDDMGFMSKRYIQRLTEE